MTPDEVIALVKQDIVKHVDGYWYFYPTSGSAYSAATLRVIADYLAVKNKPWDDEVKNTLPPRT
jgi:hypothetical protein